MQTLNNRLSYERGASTRDQSLTWWKNIIHFPKPNRWKRRSCAYPKLDSCSIWTSTSTSKMSRKDWNCWVTYASRITNHRQWWTSRLCAKSLGKRRPRDTKPTSRFRSHAKTLAKWTRSSNITSTLTGSFRTKKCFFCQNMRRLLHLIWMLCGLLMS